MQFHRKGIRCPFGIPHARVLCLVRVPRDQELGLVAPGEPGYLDTVLAGTGCKDLRASRSARLYAFGATLQEIGDLFGVTRERIRQILSRDTPWSSTDLSAAARDLAEQEIIEDLRAFHAETGRTICQAFTTWAREHDVPVPLDRRRPLRFLERRGRGMSALTRASLHAL